MLSPQAWERFRGRLHELGEFGRVLQDDFIHAENAAYQARLNPTESRAMVRAFAPSRAETFLNTSATL